MHRLLGWLMMAALPANRASAFLESFRWHGWETPSTWIAFPQHAARRIPRTSSWLQGMPKRSGQDRDDDDDEEKGMLSLRMLRNRLREEREKIKEWDCRRPPHARLEGQEFILQVLEALRYPDDPLPDAGYRILLRSCSPRWRQVVLNSIGAGLSTALSEDLVAAALGSAMSRPKNQFGILVHDDTSQEPHVVVFPSEPWQDEQSCWIECRLYSDPNSRQSMVSSSSLLVVMGWELVRRESDGAWLIDRIDWQDFRDEFRPGIGREEWMRICG